MAAGTVGPGVGRVAVVTMSILDHLRRRWFALTIVERRTRRLRRALDRKRDQLARAALVAGSFRGAMRREEANSRKAQVQADLMGRHYQSLEVKFGAALNAAWHGRDVLNDPVVNR